jgi:hypothetical protein
MSDPRIQNNPVINKQLVQEEAKTTEVDLVLVETKKIPHSEPVENVEVVEVNVSDEHSQFSEFSNPEENDEQLQVYHVNPKIN